MIISYPASLSRIIVLWKTLRPLIHNLNKHLGIKEMQRREKWKKKAFCQSCDYSVNEKIEPENLSMCCNVNLGKVEWNQRNYLRRTKKCIFGKNALFTIYSNCQRFSTNCFNNGLKRIEQISCGCRSRRKWVCNPFKQWFHVQMKTQFQFILMNKNFASLKLVGNKKTEEWAREIFWLCLKK